MLLNSVAAEMYYQRKQQNCYVQTTFKEIIYTQQFKQVL